MPHQDPARFLSWQIFTRAGAPQENQIVTAICGGGVTHLSEVEHLVADYFPPAICAQGVSAQGVSYQDVSRITKSTTPAYGQQVVVLSYAMFVLGSA